MGWTSHLVNLFHNKLHTKLIGSDGRVREDKVEELVAHSGGLVKRITNE